MVYVGLIQWFDFKMTLKRAGNNILISISEINVSKKIMIARVLKEIWNKIFKLHFQVISLPEIVMILIST